MSDFLISNWNPFCNCTNFNLNLSALDMKLKLYWLQDGKMSEAKALKDLSKHVKSCQNLPEIVQTG